MLYTVVMLCIESLNLYILLNSNVNTQIVASNSTYIVSSLDDDNRLSEIPWLSDTPRIESLRSHIDVQSHILLISNVGQSIMQLSVVDKHFALLMSFRMLCI